MSCVPPPRPIPTGEVTGPIPVIDPNAPVTVRNAQIQSLKAWCRAAGIPYQGPDLAHEAVCYGCGRRAPWSGGVNDLRRARCSKCGGRGACLVVELA